jgi:hypothetical protein
LSWRIRKRLRRRRGRWRKLRRRLGRRRQRRSRRIRRRRRRSLEERKQAILKEIGLGEVKEFKSSTNKTWLVYQSVDEIVSAFYKF